MSKLRGLIVGILLALSIIQFAGIGNVAQGEGLDNLSINEGQGIVRAYIVTDGGKQTIPINPQPGVMKALGQGMSRAEFMARHSMSPEAEASIVHVTPSVPVTINGVLYEPEQIHLFDGQRLGFTVDNDGRLYAFTNDHDLVRFEQGLQASAKDSASTANSLLDTFSYFYKNTSYGGDFIAGEPGTQLEDLSALPINFDNMLSSEIISSDATSATLFADADYGGDYFDRPGGTNISNIGSYGWNDRASSLIVWWF